MTKEFHTPLENEYLRRECRLLRWLLAGVSMAWGVIMAGTICYMTSLHAKQLASAVNAMARAVK